MGDGWGGYHEGSKVDGEVQRLVLSAIVQEDDVGNDLGHEGFAWTRADAVESRCVSLLLSLWEFDLHRRSHKRVVAGGPGSPDRRDGTYQGAENHHRSPAKACRHGNPNEVAEAKDEDGNT